MDERVEGIFAGSDQIALAYASSGEGFPVILVNGLANLNEGWAESIRSFERYFRVLTYNLRNQGKDVRGHGADYTTERHVRDLDHLGTSVWSVSWGSVFPPERGY